MNRTERKNVFKAERGEFIRSRFGMEIIRFVDCDQHRLARATKTISYLAVQRDHSLLHIDDEENYSRRIDRQLDLRIRCARDHVLRLFPAQQAESAGIDEGEPPPVPFRLSADAVARHPRLIVHNGNAPPNDAVEERRLADIGPAHDCNHSCHCFSMRTPPLGEKT